MKTIEVKDLRKSFRIYKKEPGLLGSMRSLIRRKFEDVNAVKGVSFSIEKGELIGFLGPNGAGKTTTLKMLSGLLNPSGGEVSVLGHFPYKKEKAFLKRISLVMGQKNQLWWDLPAYDGFLLNQQIYGLERDSCYKRIEALAEWLDCSDKLRVQVRRLSLGERMKMELIAALLHEPEVLFLDEPTIGLDLVSQRKIRHFVKEYNADKENTIVLTSHYMADISELCKRVVVIGKGELLYDGQLSSLIDNYSDQREIVFDLPPESTVSKSELGLIGEIAVFDSPRVRLKVKRDQVSTAVAAILKFEPLDLSIEDVSVDDVVERLFLEAGEAMA
jgi:ABC-2 type transport system ATP-binding protein